MGASVRLSFSIFVSFGLADLTFPSVLVRNTDPYLAKFRGKPGQLSPKARFLMFAGWLLPSRFKSVQLPFLHSPFHHSLTLDNPFQTAPNHHSTDTTGSFTVRIQVKMSDTSSTTTPPHLSPMAAPCSVSTFGPPWIASRAFRPVSTVGRRLGPMPRRGKIKLEIRRSKLDGGFPVYLDHVITLPLSIIHPIDQHSLSFAPLVPRTTNDRKRSVSDHKHIGEILDPRFLPEHFRWTI